MLHESAVAVLSDKGLKFYDADLRRTLEVAGAVVSEEIVRFPKKMVEHFLDKAPADVRLYDVKGNYHAPVRGSGLLTTPGDSLHVFDARKGEVRKPAVEDLARFTRLADALPEVAITRGMAMVPSEPRGFLGQLRAIEAILLNTTKHHFASTVGIEATQAWIDLTTIANQGTPLRQRPIMSAMICPVSPLQIGLEGELKMKMLVRQGVPLAATCCPIMGATTPYTLAGTLALQTAENLAILTTVQVLEPGSPVFLAPGPSSMVMSSGAISYATPESTLMRLASMDLAEYYKLPSYHSLAHSDAPILDYQAGLDRGMSMFGLLTAGAPLIGSVGQFHKGTVASPEQMLMDVEWYRHIKHFLKGFPIDADNIALEEIERCEAGGNFLTEERTMENLRTGMHFETSVFNRDPLMNAPKTALERASDRVDEILSEHQPEISDSIVEEIRTYVEERAAAA